MLDLRFWAWDGLGLQRAFGNSCYFTNMRAKVSRSHYPNQTCCFRCAGSCRMLFGPVQASTGLKTNLNVSTLLQLLSPKT